MERRAVMQFVSATRRRPIADWLGEGGPHVRQRFEILLGAASKMSAWKEPEFKRLKGAGNRAGLGEFRIKFDRKQYRLIGMNGPGPT